MSTADNPIPTLNLEHLRKQAKDLKKAWTDGAQDARDLVRGYLRPARQQQLDTTGACSLRDCQFVIARRYGFTSWQHLQEQCPSGLATTLGSADRFALLACLAYDGQDHPDKWTRAARLFHEQPGIVIHLAAAATAGDHQRVQELIAANPEAINAPTGPRAWPPLLYACYSRVQLPDHSTTAVIELLLAAGADPNSHYRWANQYRFSALTGVIGGGESGMHRQPPHPDCDHLAKALLQAGASANDCQAIYNRLVCQDWSLLSLLAEHGLNSIDRVDWQQNEHDHSQTTLNYILCWAAERGQLDLVNWAIDHDCNINEVDPNRSALYLALTNGRQEIAELLRHLGATEPTLSELETVKAACAAGRMTDKALVAEHQNALIPLVVQAASEGDCDKLQYYHELGLPINSGEVRPLHQAAWHLQLHAIEWLLQHGADADARDAHHQGKAIHWLQHKLAGDTELSKEAQVQACIALLESATSQ